MVRGWFGCVAGSPAIGFHAAFGLDGRDRHPQPGLRLMGAGWAGGPVTMGQGKRLVAGPLKAKRECPLCYLLAGPELERLPCPPCRDQGTGLVSNDAGAGRVRAHQG